MSKVKRVWIIWKCEKCGRSYKNGVYGHLRVNFKYSFKWECDKCRKINIIKIRSSCRIEWSK